MKVTDILKERTAPFASFELVPPLKGSDINKLYHSIAPLMEFAPPFLNITFHRDEIEYRQQNDGSIRRVTVTKRPGSVAIAAAIMQKFQVDVVPHIICGGNTCHRIENDLIDFNFLGIQNVMALRGDALPGQRFFVPENEGHSHSSDLVAQIANLNKGHYLDETLKNPLPTDFCIGVAGYPEKHYEAANLTSDILHLKQKVEQGADYIVTQMFYDNEKFYAFVKACREAGITQPIIPGLKPISTRRHIQMLPQVFNLDIPEALMSEIRKAKDDKSIYQLGMEWCTAQTKDLLAHGSKVVHFYTMGSGENVIEVLRNCF